MRGFVAGVVLFLGGVSFCYFKLMPLALDASAKYSQWLGISADQWTAEDYISFVCKFMLGMGLGFEMPVVILVLVKLGVLNYRMLAGFRRYMIVINLVLGAVLTTPEVLTQVMMAIRSDHHTKSPCGSRGIGSGAIANARSARRRQQRSQPQPGEFAKLSLQAGGLISVRPKHSQPPCKSN